MKDFLSYLPLIAVAVFIGYVFFKELVIIAIIILLIIFRNEVLGLCALAQIIAVVVGIPYLFFTDSKARNSILTLALFFGGIFLLARLLERNEKSKEDTKTDSSQVKSEQVTRLEKNNQIINVRSHYNDNIVRNNNSSRRETVGQPAEVPTEFYRVAELQSRFDKWLFAVENARAENKWKYGRDYERYVGYLFEREGFSVIFNGATLGSSDGGIDLFCFKSGIVYPIQCKRWKNQVGVEEIYKFAEAVESFKRNRSAYPIPLIYSKVMPLFYSTNGYTAEAERTASSKNITCQVQKFNSIREYPAVKCTALNGRKVYYLPFDRDFDSIRVGVYRGGCYKFSVLEAEQAGYHYYKGLPVENTKSSSPDDWAYWQGNRNYLCAYGYSGYFEYVDLKSCKIIYRNAEECSFTTNFIATFTRPPKIIKTAEIRFRQRKSNVNLPEFYDDEKKVWITLPKIREKLKSEGLIEYNNSILRFKNNMFRIVYRQLFKCEYIDPR